MFVKKKLQNILHFFAVFVILPSERHSFMDSRSKVFKILILKIKEL